MAASFTRGPTKKFRRFDHSTIQYGQLCFPKAISTLNGLHFAEALSFAKFGLKLKIDRFASHSA